MPEQLPLRECDQRLMNSLRERTWTPCSDLFDLVLEESKMMILLPIRPITATQCPQFITHAMTGRSLSRQSFNQAQAAVWSVVSYLLTTKPKDLIPSITAGSSVPSSVVPIAFFMRLMETGFPKAFATLEPAAGAHSPGFGWNLTEVRKRLLEELNLYNRFRRPTPYPLDEGGKTYQTLSSP